MGLALVTAASRLDLPALGTPTMPTSAISFSSRRSFCSSRRLALFSDARHLAAGRGKMLVAAPAAPALCHHQALAGFDQVAQQLAGLRIIDQGARRNRNDQVFGPSPGHIIRPALSAIIGDEAALVAEGGQRVERGHHLQDHIAAAPAVTAIWTAAGDIFLAVEMDHSIAAFAGPDVNLSFIYKHVLFFSEGDLTVVSSNS